MDLISIFSLAVAMLILAASPGPGVFATVARAISSGFRPALGVIAGIVTGDIIYLGFAIFGLAVVAQVMGEFFIFVKIAGGAYLVWLGLKIWGSKATETQISTKQREKHWSGNFASGLLITLSNPKVILFYCGFLPTFLDLSKLSFFDIAIVCSVVTSVLFFVLAGYAFLASATRQLFSETKSIKRLNRAAGFVMVATGLAIATKS
jgi:threonine/homoserine/homoserine lactone efflux protein